MPASAFCAQLANRSLEHAMIEETAFINRLYSGFNARDVDGVMALLDPDVVWANGMDGGHEHGREAVRAYWTRQWGLIDAKVDPVSISVLPSGTIIVEARQLVRDLAGKVLSDEMVGHIFERRDGKVTRFDIRGAGSPANTAPH
jgi:hypothetical protein